MANFDLTNLAVKMICPNNTVILDDTELPSVVVFIPKFKNSDVLNGGDNNTHPAFIVNGQEIPGFYYAKYQSKVNSGVAYSLPAEEPTGSVTFEKAIEYSTSKGAGWHLSTNAEWAAIALWCKKNGFLPYGNNDYGKDYREDTYRAIPMTYYHQKTALVATGTGPLKWSHDKTPSGIWDMTGNAAEWQGGIRLVWGELQIIANNDAADPDNPQNATSTCWKAINASTGALVTPECSPTDTAPTLSGNTIRLDYVDDKWKYTTNILNAMDSHRSSDFGKVTADSSIGNTAKVLLRALALLPDSDAQEADYENDKMYWNNSVNERCVTRGGHYFNAEGSGVFCINGYYDRDTTSKEHGLRVAYIPEIM